MPNLRKRLSTALMSAVLVSLLVPAASHAAIEFGNKFKNEPTSTPCKDLGTCTVVAYINPTDNGDPDASGSPVDGVITKFRYQAFADEVPGSLTFRVANIKRPDPNDQDNVLAAAVATGPTVTVQPSMDPETPILEVGAQVPVKKGQHLAVDASESVGVVYASSGSKFSYIFAPPLINGSGERAQTDATESLLVAAVVEPDADNDGAGDETQDKCSRQATTTGPCDDTKPGVQGFGVANGTITYTLSEAATVRFQLQKKGKGRKAGKKCVKQTAANKKKPKCPLLKNVGGVFSGTGTVGKNTVKLPNGKKLKPGRYKLTMTATDAAGNTTTASTNFTVAKKAKKKKKK